MSSSKFLDLLIKFSTIARLGSIAEACNELYITQPALSRDLKAFEDMVGVKLFDRKGRGIELNENGVIILKHVNNILKEWQEIEYDIKIISSKASLKVKTTLPLYSFYVWPKYCLYNPMQNGIAEKIPSNSDLIQVLKRDEYDILISRDDVDVPSANIQKVYMGRNYAGILVPANAYLSRNKVVTTEDLKNSSFLSYKSDIQLVKEVYDFLKDYNVKINMQPSESAIANINISGRYLTVFSSISNVFCTNNLNQVFIPFDLKYNLYEDNYLYFKANSSKADSIKDFLIWFQRHMNSYEEN